MVDSSDLSLGIMLGTKLNDYFGLEMAYNYYSESETDVFASFGGSGAMINTTEVTSLDFGLVGFIPVTEKFSIKGFAGLALWDASITMSSTLIEGLEAAEDGNDLYYGLGLSYLPSEKLEIGLNYKILNLGLEGGDDLEITNTSLALRFHFK